MCWQSTPVYEYDGIVFLSFTLATLFVRKDMKRLLVMDDVGRGGSGVLLFLGGRLYNVHIRCWRVELVVYSRKPSIVDWFERRQNERKIQMD